VQFCPNPIEEEAEKLMGRQVFEKPIFTLQNVIFFLHGINPDPDRGLGLKPMEKIRL